MDKILRAFLENDPAVLTGIYKYFGEIKRLVLSNSGSEDDARDLFQEAMLAMLLKAQQGKKFPQDTDFQWYFKGLCWKRWLKLLEKRNKGITFRPDWEFKTRDFAEELNEDILLHEQQQLIDKHLARMSPRCQQLIQWWSEKVPMRTIAARMGYANEVVARNQTRDCRLRLDEKVKNDPAYKDLFDL